MTSSGRCRRQWSEAGGGGSVSTLKRLLSDLLQALQIQDSWRRANNSGRRHNSSCQLTDLRTVSLPASKKSTTASHQRCSLTDVYENELETRDTAPPTSPLPPQTVRRSADDSGDDDDHVMASARSCSPSSDVENVLEALRDTTTVYFGDFTLRRVFSLEEELVNHRASENDSSDSAGLQENRKTSVHIQADRANHDDDCQSDQTTWTLPLARRLASAATGTSLRRMFRRFNGIAQERTGSTDDADCSRLADNSVVSCGATATINALGSPMDVADILTVTAPRADVVVSVSDSDEKNRSSGETVLPVKTVRRDEAHVNASTTAYRDLARADGDIQRSVEQTRNDCVVRVRSNETRTATLSLSCSASLNVNKVQKSELDELSGSSRSKSEVVSADSPSQTSETATDWFCQTKVHVTPKLKPIQRSSSNRDASRPPIQPRSSSPGSGHWRRLATPSRASVDCLPGLTTTVGASRSSSCEVLVDDDESRLADIITRHNGVTRRSSGTSSVAGDGDSTAASETDSSTACFDVDDLIENSLLDRLLMRLRSVPRDSSSSWGRRPSSRMSVSSSSDEEIGHQSGVDVTAQRAPPSRITRRRCSLLSSLDDVTSDSDFELGSSLSQLMVTSGKSPRQPPATHSNDRLSNSAASIADLSRRAQDQLNKYRNWMINSTYVPARPAADVVGTPVNCELENSAASAELSAPIAESLPAQIHVARTSRIPKY